MEIFWGNRTFKHNHIRIIHEKCLKCGAEHQGLQRGKYWLIPGSRARLPGDEDLGKEGPEGSIDFNRWPYGRKDSKQKEENGMKRLGHMEKRISLNITLNVRNEI